MFDWCITFRIHSLCNFNIALILGQKEKRNNTQGTHHHYHKIQDCHICQKFNKLCILQFCPSCVQSFKISVYFSINQNSKSLNTLNKLCGIKGQRLFYVQDPLSHWLDIFYWCSGVWFVVIASKSHWEAIPPRLFYLCGVWEELGWNPVHSGRHQPDSLH